MPRFTKAKDLERYLKKATDALAAEVLITTQSELSSTAVSPVATGRFRSSWFASEGPGTGAVAPEGANSPNNDATGLRVDSSKTYTLQNSLPYAQAICVEGRVVSKDSTWFKSFRSSRIPKIADEAGRQIKNEFDL